MGGVHISTFNSAQYLQSTQTYSKGPEHKVLALTRAQLVYRVLTFTN